MKANHTPGDDLALRRLLRESSDEPLPPRFQEQVWHRITRAETPPAFNLWAALSRWVELALPRPKLALAYVSVLLAIGVAVGTFAAQAETRRVNADLGQRYVASLDPYRSAPAAP
jgi:hypothetical protein